MSLNVLLVGISLKRCEIFQFRINILKIEMSLHNIRTKSSEAEIQCLLMEMKDYLNK